MKYSLSDNIIKGDRISSHINRKKRKLYHNIINFSLQNKNNGIFAENILRLVLDGVNLNHISKNHPHVDIAIINEIPNIAKRNEIISVKSSIREKVTLPSLIADTKAIKLESMFSYVLFANSNFEPDYENHYTNPQALLKRGIRIITEGNNSDYKAALNTAIYYLMFKNNSSIVSDYENDVRKLANDNYDLKYGKYNSYRLLVLRRLVRLKAPISLGCVYIDNLDREKCIIEKTNDVPLNRYWEKLVDIWIENQFFSAPAVKYLRLSDVKRLFGIGNDFPIKIEISIGDYKPSNLVDYSELSDEEKFKIGKRTSSRKTNKLYIATKFKDSDFGERDKEVNNFLIKTLNILEKDPKLITKFSNFIKNHS